MTDATRPDDGRLRRIRTTPHAAVRLVCLPHAGGSAGTYRPWAALTPPGVELVAAQYPGREERYGQPHGPDLVTLATGIADALAGLPPMPTVLFGHSMGAIVAYELARILAGRGCPADRLIVSGRGAPTERSGGTLHLLGDDALLAELQRLGGTAAEILEDDELRRTVLAYLREDYRLIETHETPPGAGPDCPITVLTGDADPEFGPDGAGAWHALGTGRGTPDVEVLPGDHFYLLGCPGRVVEAIVSRLDPDEAFPAAAAVNFP